MWARLQRVLVSCSSPKYVWVCVSVCVCVLGVLCFPVVRQTDDSKSLASHQPLYMAPIVFRLMKPEKQKRISRARACSVRCAVNYQQTEIHVRHSTDMGKHYEERQTDDVFSCVCARFKICLFLSTSGICGSHHDVCLVLSVLSLCCMTQMCSKGQIICIWG